MNDDEIVAYLIDSGADDWGMLHDVVWEATEGSITPDSKARLKRVLLFRPRLPRYSRRHRR
ncbi:hypothetical protein OG984_07940 [Nocardioides sp. NBC_00368]|uniref:hypothetical protein n=1 Tax=Nocardioides sp. NBC_00368 TaxID=2976000 RepID=UPI002E208BF6